MHDLWLHACILILVVDNLVRDSPLQAVPRDSRYVSPNLDQDQDLVLTISPDLWTRQDSLVLVALCLGNLEVQCQAASQVVWDRKAFHPAAYVLAVHRLKEDDQWELHQAELQGPEVPLLNTAISLGMETHSKVTRGEQWPV